MSQEINPVHDNDSESGESNFQPPPQTTISELLNKDAEDEALNRYKQALLGNAANQAGIQEDSSLEFVQMRVFVDGQTEPIEFTLPGIKLSILKLKFLENTSFQKTTTKAKKGNIFLIFNLIVKPLKCICKNNKLNEGSVYFAQIDFKVIL